MKRYGYIAIGIPLYISGCAAFTPEAVTADPKETREIGLEGSYEENFRRAIEILPLCYEALDRSVTTLISGAGAVTSKKMFRAESIEGDDYRALLLGNDVKGATSYLRFQSSGSNTRLLAYTRAWYRMDVNHFLKYVEAIEFNDASKCD